MNDFKRKVRYINLLFLTGGLFLTRNAYAFIPSSLTFENILIGLISILGILVVPTDRLLRKSGALLNSEPMVTPAAIATKIQRVRYRSRNDRRRVEQAVMG